MMSEKPDLPFHYFSSLFKNTKENCILIMDTKGVVISINNAFTNCFGYEEKDIVGKSAAILFTIEDREKRLPQEELQKVLTTGQANDNNYLVNRNKEVTWVSGESVLVKNDQGDEVILKVLQNIHKQKTSEATLRALNDFNENILQTISDSVIVLDEKMNILKVNDAFLKLIGISESAVASLNFVDFLKKYDPGNRLYKNLEKALITKTAFSNKEIEIETPEHNKRVFEISCTPLLNSQNENLLLVIHDITIPKNLEKERDDVIGFITHELRNPLSNLVLSSEVMKEAIVENDSSLMTDMLTRFGNNVARMNKMIAGLYESTKVNAGQFLLDYSEFNFGEMVSEAIETIQGLNPSFHISVIGDAEFNVIADRYRLIQVITNFLSNAIKYSNENKEVILSIAHDNQNVTVSVKDEGAGISRDYLPYVFERFFRIKKTRSIEGIGLGLYLCRQIIRAHNGHVWVESEEGKGSTFYFSIPLKPESVGK
jgi:two-component system CheB/CheR fusion protein